jgi:hypothetical protein
VQPQPPREGVKDREALRRGVAWSIEWIRGVESRLEEELLASGSGIRRNAVTLFCCARCARRYSYHEIVRGAVEVWKAPSEGNDTGSIIVARSLRTKATATER